jgi:integrase
MEKIDSEINKVNDQLRAARCRVIIQRRHDRLVLRGTLPPRPESAHSKPYRQRLSLGMVYATPAGLRAARKQALKVSEQLDEGRFTWADWVEDLRASHAIAWWVAEFERDYFNRRGRNPKVETTWDKDYSIPFGRLPQDVPLSAEALLGAIALTLPNTRARQRYCTAYGALSKFAGLEVDLSHLRGNYSPAAVNPRELPGDELVLEWDAKIPDPQWQTFYRLMAVYGLRNHECWYVDLTRLATEAIALVKDGKTGPRLVVPYPVQWWEMWFKGRSLSLPVLTVRRNCDYGLKSAQYFNRLGLPFNLYNLRHTNAARMAAGGVDGQIAAKLQGHSSKVHERIYLNFMDERHYQALVDQQRKDEL